MLPVEQFEPWRRRLSRAVAPFGQLAAIARGAKMSSTQLQKIANGTNRDPSIRTLERIAKSMNLTIAEFVSDLDDSADSQNDAAVKSRPDPTVPHPVTALGVGSASQGTTGGASERPSAQVSDLEARIADLLEDKRAYRVAIFDLSERLRLLTHPTARTDVPKASSRKSSTR